MRTNPSMAYAIQEINITQKYKLIIFDCFSEVSFGIIQKPTVNNNGLKLIIIPKANINEAIK